jgi:hypothetical protein
MPNPNGGNLTEDPDYIWSDGDVYEISQLDTVEGAAAGASFDGLGVLNEPHQILLNKAKALKVQQLTNVTNIGILQAFAAMFSGLMGPNGYLKFGVNDINKGLIQYVIQWGFVNYGAPTSEGLMGPYSFPIPFPNACEGFFPVTLTPEAPGSASAGDNVAMVSASNLPTASQFWVWNNQIAGTNKSQGFYWFAIGF